ncbi:SDR family oxidoreductase [Pseudomaricurvus alcaniphilus]|uniref:SDR family NAD(P)-dependent oxidoreductase n=1 Tax=Pseudomaricurvus alcaniphilus TaxID=1166482 RepID=UPI00140BFFD6|nr:SDR family oxidoreductase [Pseudomaricurvus alcaniphilus]NHN39251.1 SDR family oxidoreductase [Pseudomaricurvus alcaniphilus]
MDLQLKDKVVLVTGSSKGIGFAVAKTLAAEGCKLGICARNAEEVKAAADKLRAMGVEVHGEVVDVTDSASLERWIKTCAETLGGVDGFVANVSAGGADAEESGWRAGFEADVLASWKAVNAVKPYLEKSACGSIVSISSTAALEQFAGAVPYGAMKAALLNYFGNLAQDLAPLGIRVNSVSPGPIFIEGGAWDQIKQSMPEVYESTVAAIPAGRMGKAEEVGVQIALLLSPLSGYTTGTNVVIDGGFTKRIQF